MLLFSVNKKNLYLRQQTQLNANSIEVNGYCERLLTRSDKNKGIDTSNVFQIQAQKRTQTANPMRAHIKEKD